MSPLPSSLGFGEGPMQPLEKRYEVIKSVGNGSFGSVVLARVRGTKNTVAIKSMKKTFDSFSECMRLREVQCLRAIPRHPHIVPVLEAFLDPQTHTLHLVMELMEFNLYQLLKARENKPFDPRTVQVILWQVVSALQHIHANGFFHRDIKPENVLISTIPAHHHSSSRSLHTPPSTPPTTSPSTYLVKLADFGLAREIRSRPPYTTYVSTRWYRAPEVLLRAEEYGAPVDIWAVGAMAIEVATLRPMFPGSNEIDQLWKVCEVMGTPEREGRERDWHSGDDGRGRRVRIGGGAWGSAMKLAHAINFKFPNIQPMDMTTILTSPWPRSLSDWVVWCLAWDPKRRPTSSQCLAHEYFKDVERYLPLREPLPTPPASMHSTTHPLNPKQSNLKGLGIEIPPQPRGARHQPTYSSVVANQYAQQPHEIQPQQSTKGGWFRGRDKKRDSSLVSAQPPQLPQINLATPALQSVAPKIPAPPVQAPAVNGGMAFSPQKTYSRPVEQRTREEPKKFQPQIPPKVQEQLQRPPPQQVQVQAQPQWQTQPPPIPVQQNHVKTESIPNILPALPTIRPLSPLQGGVFGDFAKPSKQQQEPEKTLVSPIRPPQSTDESLLNPHFGTKVGRQLSSTSRSDIPGRTSQQISTPLDSPNEDASSSKQGFFSHFRKRARKRMSSAQGYGDESPSPETSSTMPISPLPQFRPIQLTGSDGKSLRNSVVMEDFFEDARSELSSADLLRQVDEVLSKGDVFTGSAGPVVPGGKHITIAPSPTKSRGSSLYPPSSHKLGGIPAQDLNVPNRHVPSPYPSKLTSSPTTNLPPLSIPKRGSSRALKPGEDSSTKARKSNIPSPLPRHLDIPGSFPGSYPLSSSPEDASLPLPPPRRPSIPMSRSTSNLSVNLPGAYPRTATGRYNSSSSGLSSAASYRTAYDPDVWETEDQKQKDEQTLLQQSLMDATRAIKALEKYEFANNVRSGDLLGRDESTIVNGTWPTPPYVEEDVGMSAKKVKPPRKSEVDYFQLGLPSPPEYR